MDKDKHNTWIRSDGTVVSLDEMNEHHLRNALRKSLEKISKLEEEMLNHKALVKARFGME